MSEQSGYWDRLQEKGLEGQFLFELEHGYELSPRQSQGILETVKLIFGQDPTYELGKVPVYVVSREEPAGRSLAALEKVRVWISLDAGSEDLEVHRSYGPKALRQVRLLRITEEIIDQGGIATEEDLSRLFQVSVRTVRRDIAVLRGRGLRVFTRGFYQDIGRTISHKSLIVGLYLSGKTYTEICRQSRHSARSVRRYVQDFARVVTLFLQDQSVSLSEGAFYLGVSERLVDEYQGLYEKYAARAESLARIEQLVERARGGVAGAFDEKGGRGL